MKEPTIGSLITNESEALDPSIKNNPTALMLKATFEKGRYDLFLSLLIALNIVLIVVETDMTAREEQVPAWLWATNYALVGIYLLEVVLKVYVYRITLDLFCQLSNVLSLDGAAYMTVFRVFRTLRFARTVRVLMLFPELHMMLQGMAGAVNSLLWGALLLGMLVLMWSILAVQFINPLNSHLYESHQLEDCTRCSTAYSSTWDAAITILQTIIFGDNWGINLPIITTYPMSLLYFLFVYASIQLGMMNLILAVIVEAAAAANKSNLKIIAKLKRDEYKDAFKQLTNMCRSLDVNSSGTISIEELHRGFEKEAKFRGLMNILGIRKGEIDMLFKILDQDDSGEVAYKEFVEQLTELKTDDQQMMLIFIKFCCMEIRSNVLQQIHMLNRNLEETITRSLDDVGENQVKRLESSLGNSLRTKFSESENHILQRIEDYERHLELAVMSEQLNGGLLSPLSMRGEEQVSEAKQEALPKYEFGRLGQLASMIHKLTKKSDMLHASGAANSKANIDSATEQHVEGRSHEASVTKEPPNIFESLRSLDRNLHRLGEHKKSKAGFEVHL